MKLLSTAFIIVLSASLSWAKTTTYPSINWLPFPWEEPEMLINLESIETVLPIGEFSMQSKLPTETQGESKLVDGCKLKIEQDKSKENFVFSVSGPGLTFKVDKLVEAPINNKFALPTTHYVAPLRDTPYVYFGFPDVFVTTGELEEEEDGDELKLVLKVRRGFTVGKGGINKPWIVAPSDVPESIWLYLDKKGTSIKGVLISAHTTESSSFINCRSEKGIRFKIPINFNNLFLRDLP